MKNILKKGSGKMGKRQKEYEELARIGKKIGLKTLGDYKLFSRIERQPNETMLEALKRYEKQLESEVEYGI